jgi:hypothetical protein
MPPSHSKPASLLSTTPSQSSSNALHASERGAPGVQVTGAPPEQTDTRCQHAPVPQVASPSPSSTIPLQSLSRPSQTSLEGTQTQLFD